VAATGTAPLAYQWKKNGVNIAGATAASYTTPVTTTGDSGSTFAVVVTNAAGAVTSAATTLTVNNATDTTPPTVSITAPASGATVSGTVSVTANASDNVGVASVQFQLDGANLGSLDTASPFSTSWSTATASNGAHTLQAIAKDAAGNSTTSAAVTVTVSNTTDTTAPSVPGGLAATAVSPSQINLSWTASTDNVGVTGYNVFRGGTKIGTSAGTTYQSVGLTPSTSYTFTVSAFDAAGNTSGLSAGASATTQASSGGGLPSSLGWYQIPNTQMINVCPSGFACQNIILNWNGGVADTTRNRLIVWGGGHTDYDGNEVYALDLNALSFVRLNNPSPVNTGGCVDTLSDGKPNSRHTYGGLSYVPSLDQMVATGGSLACSGGSEANDLWTLSMANLQWTKICGSGNACGYNNGLNGKIAAYDPNTGNVFIDDRDFLYAYNTTSKALTRVTGVSNTLHTNSEIDPVRKRMFVAGDGAIYYINVDPSSSGYGSTTNISVGGCSTPAGSGYPGMAYDSIRDKIVMWAGGSTIYEINLTGNPPTCTANGSFSGGPGAQQSTGTHGRFRYFPSLGVFALVNDATQNTWALRVSPGSGGGTSGPAISGVAVNSITTTGATVGWTTDVASTTQVEYGLTTAYGIMTTLNSSMVTSHSQAVASLTAGTLYHYRVHSKNSGGVESISGDSAFSTNNTTDTTPPTVSLTAPSSGATVSGTVTVSANASDNVGVTSVQFTLDGANLGSADSAGPYQTAWDTTSAANGAHILSAVARDAAGNATTAVTEPVNVANQVTTGELSLAARCADPGVTLCLGLDKATDLISTGGNGLLAGNQSTGVLDTTVKPADGSLGSLKFTVTTSGDQNSAGNYTHDFGAQFDTGQVFYLQFRMRSSDGFAQNYNAAGEKHFILWHNAGGGSCTDVQFVMINETYKGFPSFYQSCSPGLYGNFSDGDLAFEMGAYTPPSDPTAGSGGYLCSYRRGAGRNTCANYPANNWQTYYLKVTPGNWGSSNTRIEAWVANEGQNLRKFFDKPDCNFTRDNANKKWGRIDLLPYDTGRSATVANVMNVWYAGLIVSRNPIPPPTGPTP